MSSYQRTPSERGRSNRRRGHDFERWVARAIRPIFPNAKRGLQTRGGTSESLDIEGTPFAFELKVGAQPNIRAAMKQVQEARPGGTPVVVSKRDREGALVTMRFEDWLELVAAVYGIKEEPCSSTSE